MYVLTCEYENSRQVIENIISPTVIMKYCGTMANICIEFSIKGEREKEQKYQIIIQDIDFTNFFF